MLKKYGLLTKFVDNIFLHNIFLPLFKLISTFKEMVHIVQTCQLVTLRMAGVTWVILKQVTSHTYIMV